MYNEWTFQRSVKAFWQNEYQTNEQLVQAIEEYIHFYNFERYQQRLNGLSPMEYRKKAA
ncbi:IS3 family transposase [Lentibacillus halodurans]|uniref:IS3 family transposase n=1 Tax=Lentibacillus halodurans TaxID=237679 RepID=UPI000B7C704D|nr:IS3 family transposase [Lentibacillus halodurans]